MVPYLLMFAVPGLYALTGTRRTKYIFWSVGFLYWLMIGFRYQIGMDWNNYYYKYLYEVNHSLTQALFNREPGYQILNWMGHATGGGLILVDAIAGMTFCVGYFCVAKRCREPFLAIAVGTPLLVVAFAMSGLRQSISLGIIFYLFATWEQRTTVARAAIVLFATLFHFSAIFVLIFVAAASNFSLVIRSAASILVAAFVLAVIKLAPESMEAYSHLYVSGENKMSAPGAVIHVGALTAPGLIYLLLRKKWAEVNGHSQLYFYLALASLVMMPGILISSVAAYRFALYFWPMAMYVWSGLPALIESGTERALYRFFLIVGSFAILVGWLLFANNSAAWLPYQNWLLEPEGASLLRHRFTH